MKTYVRGGTQTGFTLIEILSVLVIMSVLATVVIKRFDLIFDNASLTALRSGIRELNTRETVGWTEFKLSDTGYTNDAEVYDKVDKNLGPAYIWESGPAIIGGRLQFKSQSIDLNRIASTSTSTASWK